MRVPKFSPFIWGLIFFCYGSSPLVADTQFDHSIHVVPERSLEVTSLKEGGFLGFSGHFRGESESDERVRLITPGAHHLPNSHHAFRDIPRATFPHHAHQGSFRLSKKVEPIKPSPQVRIEINDHLGPDPPPGGKFKTALKSSYISYLGEKPSEGTTRHGKSIGPSLTYGVPSSTKAGRVSYRPADIYTSLSGEISDTSGENAFSLPKKVTTQVNLPKGRDNRVQQSSTSFRLGGIHFSRPGSFGVFSEHREVDGEGDTSGEVFHPGKIEFLQPRGFVRTRLRDFGRDSKERGFVGSQRLNLPVGASREKSRNLPKNSEEIKFSHLYPVIPGKYKGFALRDQSGEVFKSHNVKFAHPYRYVTPSDQHLREDVRDDSQELIRDQSRKFHRLHGIKFRHPHSHVTTRDHYLREVVHEKSNELIRDQSHEFQRSPNIKLIPFKSHVTIKDHRQQDDVHDESYELIRDQSQEFQRSHNIKFAHPLKDVTIGDRHNRNKSQGSKGIHRIKFTHPISHEKSSYHRTQEGLRDKSLELIGDQSQEFQRSSHIHPVPLLGHVVIRDPHSRRGKRIKSHEVIPDLTQIHQNSYEIKSPNLHRYVKTGHHHQRGHARDESRELIHDSHEIKSRVPKILGPNIHKSHVLTIVRTPSFRLGFQDESHELSRNLKELQKARNRGFTNKNLRGRVRVLHRSSDEAKYSHPHRTVIHSHQSFNSNERFSKIPHRSNPFSYLPSPRDSENKFYGYGDHILDSSFELRQKYNYPPKDNLNYFRGTAGLGINFHTQAGIKDDSKEVPRTVSVPSFASQNERRGPFEFYIPNISGRTYFPPLSSQKDSKESDERGNTISSSNEDEDKEKNNGDSLEPSLNTEGRTLEDDFDFDEFIKGTQRSLTITNSEEEEEEEGKFLNEEGIRGNNSIALRILSRDFDSHPNSQSSINDISTQDSFLSSIGSKTNGNILARTSLKVPLSQKISEASFNYRSNENVEKDPYGDSKLPPLFDTINSLAKFPLFNPFDLLINKGRRSKDNTQVFGDTNKGDAGKLGLKIKFKNGTLLEFPSPQTLKSRSGVDIDEIVQNRKDLDLLVTSEERNYSGNHPDFRSIRQRKSNMVLNMDDIPDILHNTEGIMGTFPDALNGENILPELSGTMQNSPNVGLRIDPLFLSKFIDVERSNILISDLNTQIALELENEKITNEKRSSLKRRGPIRASQFKDHPETPNQNKRQEIEAINTSFLPESNISPSNKKSNIKMNKEQIPALEEAQKTTGHKRMRVSGFLRQSDKKIPIPRRITTFRPSIDTFSKEEDRKILLERREQRSNNRKAKETTEESAFSQNTHDQISSSVTRPQSQGQHNGWTHQTPRTSFSCQDQQSDGYFADVEAECKIFHLCHGLKQDTFVCPDGTSFSQDLGVCVWRFTNKCHG